MSEGQAVLRRAGLLGAMKDLAKGANRFDASIITTFAFNGAFYEDALLRAFERAGSRLNIVLADARQLSRTMEDPARRPLRAGRDYILCPVDHPRAFHPKLLMLLSEKEALLAVGSHNLTDAGFGHNEEVTTFWDRKAPPPAGLLQDALDYALGWLSRAKGLPLPHDEIAARLNALAATARRGDDIGATLAVDGQRSLLDTLEGKVAGRVQEAIVAGPYFDSDFALLRRLDDVFNPERILVALDPMSAHVGNPAGAPTTAQFTSIEPVVTLPTRRGEPGFMHAKLIALRTSEGLVVAAGSANPTLAGWTHVGGGNAEANVIFTGEAAENAFDQLGLSRLQGAPLIDPAVLLEAADRSAAQRRLEVEADAQAGHVPVLPAQARPDGILVTGVAGRPGLTLLMPDGFEHPVAVYSDTVGDEAWVPGERLATGPCQLMSGGQLVAHVIVHDPAAVRASLVSRGGAQLLASLGRIDQYDGFDEVFDLISKHVLAAPASTGPARTGKPDDSAGIASAEDEGTAPFGPRSTSLAGEAAASAHTGKAASGLVSELIAALLASLHTPARTIKDGDGLDKDTEDVEDDELDPEELARGMEDSEGPASVDWPALTQACGRKVDTLTRRLKAKAKDAGDTSLHPGQVLAVLCLAQKLRMLPPPPDTDEYSAKQSLVAATQLEALHDIALSWAYATGQLSGAAASSPETQLLAKLLIWHARESGANCWAMPEFNEAETGKAKRLQQRANLVAVAFVVAEAGEWEPWLTNRDDQLARWEDACPVPEGWWGRHLKLGQELRAQPASALPGGNCTLDVGTLVLAGAASVPYIVEKAASKKAWLLVPGSSSATKAFTASHLRAVEPSDPWL